MAQIILLLALILAGVLALFGVQNTETVTLHFLWVPARSMPLVLVILGSVVLGALLSFLVALLGRVRHAHVERVPLARFSFGLPGRVRHAFAGSDRTRQHARRTTPSAQRPAAAEAEERAAAGR